VPGSAYCPPPIGLWQLSLGRDLRHHTRITGHRDVGPWRIVTRGGLRVALSDWEFAGPMNPLAESAQACWPSAKLHSSDVPRVKVCRKWSIEIFPQV